MRVSRSRFFFGIVCSVFSIFLMASKGCIKIEPDINKEKDPVKQEKPVHSWSLWKKKDIPVFNGQFQVAKNPQAVKDGDVYRLFYTCYDPHRNPPGAEICQIISSDGQTWDHSPSIDPNVSGRILATGPGHWDTAHEAPTIAHFAGKYFLFFLGYLDRGGLSQSSPASLGVAESTDLVAFNREPDPVLSGSVNSYDQDLIKSPSFIRVSDKLAVMFYVGHCLSSCQKKHEPQVLAATSTDLKTWNKLNRSIVNLKSTSWKDHSVVDVKASFGVDGFIYLFLTLKKDSNPSVITIARSKSIVGPWLISDQAILEPGLAGSFDESGIEGSSAIIEGNRVFIWFHGTNQKGESAIGFAESTMPLYQ